MVTKGQIFISVVVLAAIGWLAAPPDAGAGPYLLIVGSIAGYSLFKFWQGFMEA